MAKLIATQAEDTVTRLQRGDDNGLPVLIPGAREIRVRPPDVAPAEIAAAVPTRAPAAGDDRQRLERAREGGGAPSQRTGSRPATFLSKLWRMTVSRCL